MQLLRRQRTRAREPPWCTPSNDVVKKLSGCDPYVGDLIIASDATGELALNSTVVNGTIRNAQPAASITGLTVGALTANYLDANPDAGLELRLEGLPSLKSIRIRSYSQPRYPTAYNASAWIKYVTLRDLPALETLEAAGPVVSDEMSLDSLPKLAGFPDAGLFDDFSGQTAISPYVVGFANMSRASINGFTERGVGIYNVSITDIPDVDEVHIGFWSAQNISIAGNGKLAVDLTAAEAETDKYSKDRKNTRH